MDFTENRKQRKYEKEKRRVKKQLSLHLFSVTAAEQNSPSHWKLKKDADTEEKKRYLEHRMKLRKKWVDKFFEFHPDISSEVRDDVKKEAYEDIEIFKKNLAAELE
jgi:hypothetical protein